jgi:hypothetical protein
MEHIDMLLEHEQIASDKQSKIRISTEFFHYLSTHTELLDQVEFRKAVLEKMSELKQAMKQDREDKLQYEKEYKKNWQAIEKLSNPDLREKLLLAALGGYRPFFHLVLLELYVQLENAMSAVEKIL